MMCPVMPAALGLALLAVVFALLAGLAYRRRFRGDSAIFYLTLISLILPSILISLGIGILFDQLGVARRIEPVRDVLRTEDGVDGERAAKVAVARRARRE